MQSDHELKEVLLQFKGMNDEEMKSKVIKVEKQLLVSLLKHIGSEDAELRDELIYRTFHRLIDEEMLSLHSLKSILRTCLDQEHLFLGIGERAADSVFTRSFSSLVIAAILEKDQSKRFLSKFIFIEVFDKIQDYLSSEQDTRGYVEEKGWAHSIAHGADLLASAVGHPFFLLEESKVALNCVEQCLFKEGIYVDDEDERLIFVIDALLDRNFSETELEKWILHIFNELEAIFQAEGFSLAFFQRKTNIINFIKTLYFRLGFENRGGEARCCIEVNLKMWHEKVYTNQ